MQLLPLGKQTFFNAAGQPLAFGKVFFYIPNTSTLATTYQDAAGQTPNTNPVVLDGNGQAVIFGTGSYRQVVQDANGATIWDQMTSSPDSKFTNLGQVGAGNGASLIAFEQNGTNAVARTVNDKLLEVVSVKDFGAAGDGAADDATAFNNALRSGAKTVIAPDPSNGFYRLASGITVPDGVTLIGSSMIPADQMGTPHGTVLKFDNNVMTCVTLGNGNNQTANVEKLVIWRNGTPPAGSVGIYYNQINNPRLHQVAVVNHAILHKFYASGSAGLGAQLHDCYGSDVTDKYFYIDGWPELRVTGGRWGRIGAGEAAGNAFLYITASGAAGAGMGPNTLCFENSQFNQGTKGPSYWLEFDSVNIGQGNQVIYNFINCHVENLSSAFIKSTSTAPYIQKLNLISCNLQSGSASFFAVDPATQLDQMAIVGCHIGAADMTLATGNMINRLIMTGCEIGGNVSLTGYANAQNNAIIASTAFNNNMTLAGVWADLRVNAMVAGTVTNNAVQFNSSSNLEIKLPGVDYYIGGSKTYDTYNTNSGFKIDARTARGTSAAPTVSQQGDAVGYYQAWLYDGSAFGRMGNTRFISSGATPSAGSTPGGYVIGTTSVGANAPTDRVTVDPSGYWYPVTDNAYQSGKSGNRWSSLWATNGTIQTSDGRYKTDITDSALGLSFINKLRPVSYKWKSGGTEVVRQVYLDKDGNEIPEGESIPHDAIPGRIITKDRPGKRTHWGLIAQEVKAVADEFGVDFGGWILTDTNDPNSQQAVRYDQLIAPLIKAVQELTVKVAALEAK